jgi:hypothetical protein
MARYCLRMGEAIKKLLTSKRNLIMLLTAVFNCVLAVLAAVGHQHDPAEAAATWDPIIAAVALLVTYTATQVIKSYGRRDPGQQPSGMATVDFIAGTTLETMTETTETIESGEGGENNTGERGLARPGVMVLLLALAAGALALPGCMHALRPHAEDHYVQAQVVADKCRAETEANGYPESPCSPDLQEHLDELAKQAACVHAITKGEECGDK